MADSTGDSSGQHAEGVQHVASNTTPPGTEDTSRGTEGGVGTGAESDGVSSSKLEPTSSQGGGMVETVKSYLGYGSTSGTAAETGQLGTTGDTKNAQDTTTGNGSGSGISGAAASAASAVGLGSTSTSSDSTSSSNSGSTLETAKEKVQDVANAAGAQTSTSGSDDHKPPQPAGGKPHKLENESAIPTAGGERLGEKHWGESKIVPDDPSKKSSTAGISSEEGQPTKQTSDNTAKNTGGATGPPGSSNTGSSGDGEEKTKITDKIKDKLNIGKKE